MNTLEKSSELIILKLKECFDLFEYFECVFLFGSVLNLDDNYNDVDILLLYVSYSDEIEKQIKIIRNKLEKLCNTSIDLTVLSFEEEKEVAFIDRIAPNYLKIK